MSKHISSLLAAALQLAGIIDPSDRGGAKRDPQWGPLLEAMAPHQHLSNGLAAFANWCAREAIAPGEVNDAVVAAAPSTPEPAPTPAKKGGPPTGDWGKELLDEKEIPDDMQEQIRRLRGEGPA